jgi:hypothetical protein
MINGRDVGRTLDVFQHGHFGWFCSDSRGIARGPYPSEVDACCYRWRYRLESRMAEAQAQGFQIAVPQFDQAASEACSALADAMTAPQPGESRLRQLSRLDREHAATWATLRAARRAVAWTAPNEHEPDKA